MSTVPNLQMDVVGEYLANAYSETRDYRIHLKPHQHGYRLMVEDSGGGIIWMSFLTDEDVDGLQRMASTDHSLSGYEDDWKIPEGMERVLTWVVLDDNTHFVRLNSGQIDEVAEWFEYATGEKVWDGGDEWEF